MPDICDNCRLCGEPLTKREKRILKDQCFDCLDEIGD